MKPISNRSARRFIRSITTALLFLISVFAVQRANAILYFTEGFDYAAGELGSPWSGANTNMLVVTNDNLTYPGVADTTPSGSGLLAITSGTSHNQSANFISTAPYITSGTVYMSFLIECTTLPTANEYLIGIVSNTASLNGGSDEIDMYVGANANNGGARFGVRSAGGSVGGAEYISNSIAVGQTNFIVLKYTYNEVPGVSNLAEIWLNPSPVGTQPASNNIANGYAWEFGTNAINLAAVSFKCQSVTSQGNWNVDAIRVGSTWADVTPAPNQCISANAGGIIGPNNATVYSGLQASFSVLSGGTQPTYQWQSSTNSGSTWANIVSATNSTYITPQTTVAANNGNQFRCTVSVSCSSDQTNSPAATLTVNPAPVFGGVIVSNTWQSDNFSNPPPPIYSDAGSIDALGHDIESCWFALGSGGTGGGISVPAPGSMDLLPQTNSRTWLTYFTTTNGPVQLNLGETLEAITVFQPQGVVQNTNGNLGFGLFNSFAPGAARTSGNNTTAGSEGTGLQGYDFVVNFSTVFSTNTINPTPIQIQVRTNLGDADIMGTSGDFTPLGSGGSSQNASGFADNGIFTNIFSVTRNANGSVTIGTQFIGPSGFNVSYSTNDFLGTNNTEFDTFAIRPVNNLTTATNIQVMLMEVETVTNAAVVTPIPLVITPSGANVILTWTNPVFNLYASPNVTGTYSAIVPAPVSGYSVPATNAQRYFRLVH